MAVKVAEAKYPPRVFKHVWIFDHSCGHTAFAPDTLVASILNRKPGGKQPVMHDTVWAGKPQKLVLDDSTPKGTVMILEERGDLYKDTEIGRPHSNPQPARRFQK